MGKKELNHLLTFVHPREGTGHMVRQQRGRPSLLLFQSFIINKNTLKKLRAFLGSDQEILGRHLDVSKGTRLVFHKAAWEAITGDL